MYQHFGLECPVANAKVLQYPFQLNMTTLTVEFVTEKGQAGLSCMTNATLQDGPKTSDWVIQTHFEFISVKTHITVIQLKKVA